MRAAAVALGIGALVVASSSGLPDQVEGARFVAHVEGAPPGHAGGDGELSCHACHNELELNEPDGRLEIVGFPERYEVGTAYTVTVVLTSEGTERAGFQATVRSASRGDVGSMKTLDVRTKVVADSLGHPYVGHNASSTFPVAPNRATWSFEWTSPTTPAGAVTLYVAANSANGDNSPLGDYVYTKSASADQALPR